MTIRASQVIPVYPLTTDLHVGDVFLVQTPVSMQEKQYRQRGFLALDDHLYRLPYTNFSKMYFDAYWKDSYGNTPHLPAYFTNSTASGTNIDPTTNAIAPRVAFPTYSFHAQSGYGLSAAFPIQGVPVALSFLGTDQVNGSVSISDARTYAGDKLDLWQQLTNWAGRTENRLILANTAKNAAPVPVYLRVVSRVHLARAMEMSLSRAKQRSGAAKAGWITNSAMLTTNGAVNPGYSNLISSLNAPIEHLASIAQIGGSASFNAVSDSTVGMSQSFDQMLAIGYLGFDVPVYESGSLGIPIPTFQRFEGRATEWIVPIFDTRGSLKTLRHIAKTEPATAHRLMQSVASKLQSREFAVVQHELSQTDPLAMDEKSIRPLRKSFRWATLSYLMRPNVLRFTGSPQRLKQFNNAFEEAYRDLVLTERTPSSALTANR